MRGPLARRWWARPCPAPTGWGTNEPALVDLCTGVAEKSGLQVAAEAPPAHEPQSNGSAENA
eukprot:3857760-Alexandrium_andersonii.AAC.1